MRRGLLALFAIVALAACGGADEERAVGVTHAGDVATGPVELELRTTDNAFLAIGDLRGRVTVIYCFATYDGVSQAGARPLSRFVRHHPEVHVVAIATQPNPALFAEAWVAALTPPFVVTFDPSETLIQGTTDLGHIGAVPTYILLDENGVEAHRHVGFASQNQLETMLVNMDSSEH